jgi:GT2 family glycosyltransferase
MSATDRIAAPDSPRASIVVLSYNGLEETTRPCVESILQNTPAEDYELVLVDNGSMDGTPEFLREIADRHHHVKLCLNVGNRGYAGGNNDGMRLAAGRFIILLNNDTLVPEGWLDPLVRLLEERDDVGLVGPVTNSAGNEQRIVLDGLDEASYEPIAAGYVSRQRGQWFRTEKLGFFCVAIRRSAYEEIGELDEKFGLGMFEDDDYCFRAKAAGHLLAVVEDCFVYHKGSVSFGKLGSEKYLNLFSTNRKYFFDKHGVVWQYSGLLESAWARFKSDVQEVLGSSALLPVAERIAARLPVVTDMIRHVHALGAGGSGDDAAETAVLMLQAKQQELLEMSVWAADLRDKNESLVADFLAKQASLIEVSEWASGLSRKNAELLSLVTEKQQKLMETSDWASGLSSKNAELIAQVTEKQRKLMEVSDWGSRLSGRNAELLAELTDKQRKLMEVSDFAEALKKQNDELTKKLVESGLQ